LRASSLLGGLNRLYTCIYLWQRSFHHPRTALYALGHYAYKHNDAYECEYPCPLAIALVHNNMIIFFSILWCNHNGEEGNERVPNQISINFIVWVWANSMLTFHLATKAICLVSDFPTALSSKWSRLAWKLLKQDEDKSYLETILKLKLLASICYVRIWFFDVCKINSFKKFIITQFEVNLK